MRITIEFEGHTLGTIDKKEDDTLSGTFHDALYALTPAQAREMCDDLTDMINAWGYEYLRNLGDGQKEATA